MSTIYNIPHQEYIQWQVDINWTKPHGFEVLNYGLIDEDEEAYLYCYVAEEDGWWPYYIGKVYYRNVSARQRDRDHRERLSNLKQSYPDKNFYISLGTPEINGSSDFDDSILEAVEGLLIYANWHEDMINKRKIDYFKFHEFIKINNTGFVEHLYKESFYGIVNSE